MFSKAELSIITDVVHNEKEFGHELPANSFYKSIALAAARRLQFTWPEIIELFKGMS